MTLRTLTAFIMLALMAIPATLVYAQATPVGTGSTSLGTILVDANGMTLYTFAPDSPNTSTCSGACAGAWPPATVDAETAALVQTGGAGMAEVGVFDRGDGMQLTWNGKPLYRFAPDSAPGQANGDGINGFGGLWNVVRVG